MSVYDAPRAGEPAFPEAGGRRVIFLLDAASRLENAVAAVIAEGKHVTYDLKPTRDDPSAVGTSEYADAIIERLG